MVREGTDYSNEGGFYDCDKIRFRSGYPEKIGGWTRLSANAFLGVARALWNWIDLDSQNNYLGVGTNLKYYIEKSGAYYDITPIRITYTHSTTPNTDNCFTTTNGSKVVLVTIASNGATANDFVTFSGVVGFAGIPAGDFNKEFQITYLTGNTFRITVATAANASTTGGGTATVAAFQINTGLAVYVPGTGWGAGPWGRGTWGSSYATTAIGSQLLLWTNDNYGADLLIAQRGGKPYYWTDTTGVNVRAKSLESLANAATQYVTTATFGGGVTTITLSNVVNLTDGCYITGTNIAAGTYVTTAYIPGSTSVPISQATGGASAGSYAISYAGSYVPTKTNQIIASAIQRFVILFGANSYSPAVPATSWDPMLVRWSDQENAYQWVPMVTNQAGEFRLSNGSFIMGSRATRQEILIWTDSCLYSMQYLGAPLVWGFNILMDNISVMSPSSMITINNVTYWMGTDKFFVYSGRVDTLSCSLRQYVFNDINKSQSFQVFAAANPGFNEVWWFYCSTNSTTIDKYVVYNYEDKVWYYGTMARTAWLSTGTRPYPMATDYNNRVLYQENGTDDASGVPTLPITAFVQSSDFDIGDGHNFAFVWRILPDVNFNGSTVDMPSVTMTVKPRQNSGAPYGIADSPTVQSADNYGVSRSYNIQQFSGQVYTRLHGRQMAFRIESVLPGVAWQLGVPRIDIRQDGKR